MLSRLALAEDREAVLALGALEATELAAVPFCPEHAGRMFDRAVSQATPTLFVVERRPDRQAVGFAVCAAYEYLFSPRLHVVLETIFVRPDSRGTRAAASLLSAVTGWARIVGASEIFLASAGRDQERHARFFARLGAVPTGTAMKITV